MVFLRTLVLSGLLLGWSNLCLAQADSGWSVALPDVLESTAQSGQPVLLLLEIEGQRDPEVADRLEAAASGLEGSPRLARLLYPAEPYVQVAEAQEFVRWADLTGVVHLPSVAWLGADGRPYGLIDLSEMASDEITPQLLENLHESYSLASAAFLDAESLTGMDKAHRLHEGIEHVAESCRSSYLDVMREIVGLDPENTAMLREKYAPILADVLLDAAIQEQVYPLIDSASYAEARLVLKQLSEEHAVSADQKQLLLAFQAELLLSQGQTEEAVATFDQAISIAPGSASAGKLKEAKLRLINP